MTRLGILFYPESVLMGGGDRDIVAKGLRRPSRFGQINKELNFPVQYDLFLKVNKDKIAVEATLACPNVRAPSPPLYALPTHDINA